MMELTASKALRGEVTVPGDKSISHRSVNRTGNDRGYEFFTRSGLPFNNQLLSKARH